MGRAKTPDSSPTVPKLAVTASFFALCVVQASLERVQEVAGSDRTFTNGYNSDNDKGRGDVFVAPMPSDADSEVLAEEGQRADTTQKSMQRSSKETRARFRATHLLGKASGGTLQLLAAASLIAAGVVVLLRMGNIRKTARGAEDLPVPKRVTSTASLPSVSNRLLLGFVAVLVISTALTTSTENQAGPTVQTPRWTLLRGAAPASRSKDGPIEVVTIGRNWTEQGKIKDGSKPFSIYFNGKKFNITFSNHTEGVLNEGTSTLEGGLLKSLQEALSIPPEGVELDDRGTTAWVWGLDYRVGHPVLFWSIDTVRGVKKEGVSYEFHIPSEVNATLTTPSEQYPAALDDFLAVLQRLVDEGSSRFDRPTANDGHLCEEWFFPYPVLKTEELRVLNLHKSLWKEEQPPLLRYKNPDATEEYVLGRGWRYDKERLPKELRDILYLYSYKDGQAAIKFTFGGTTNFTVFLSRDLEMFLKKEGLLDEFVKGLSVSPTLPKFTKNASWREYWTFTSKEEVMVWGNDTHPHDDYQVWHEGDHNYKFLIPKKLMDRVKDSGKPSLDLYWIVVKALLSIERANLKNVPS